MLEEKRGMGRVSMFGGVEVGGLIYFRGVCKDLIGQNPFQMK